MNKCQLRKHIAELIASLSEAEKRRQSKIVFAKLIAHPKYKLAQRVSLYLSTNQELDTEPILRHSLEVEKKQCFIPFVSKTRRDGEEEAGEKASRMLMIELRSMEEYEALPENNYGIKEFESAANRLVAKAKQPEAGLDLVIVPGVAFNLSAGERLGHGKGYYDEFLNNWAKQSGGRRVYSIGLALREQAVADRLPVSDHDYILDEVLTAA